MAIFHYSLHSPIILALKKRNDDEKREKERQKEIKKEREREKKR